MSSRNEGLPGSCREAVHIIDDSIDGEGHNLKWH